MKNFKTLLLLPIATLFIQACGDNKRSNNFNAKTQVDNKGLEFIKTATESGLTEIKASETALKTSKNPQVINFAKMMIADHTKAGQDIQKVADEKLVIKAVALLPEHTKHIDSLANLSGAAFDKAYMAMMLTDHEKAVALFTEASTNRIEAVQDVAKKTLPALKMHLNSAKEVAAGLK